MKKRLTVALAAVAVLVVGSAAAVMAQTPTPQNPGQNGWGWGCGGFGGFGGGSNGNYDPANNPTLQRLADTLKISSADLAKELQAGKSVAEVAQSKNVSEQSLIDVLLAPQVDLLKLRVQYGYMTQEQADSARQFMADRAKNQLEQKGFVGGFGGGFGGMMGGYGPGGNGGYGPGGMMGGYGGPSGNSGYGPGGMMGRGFRGSSY